MLKHFKTKGFNPKIEAFQLIGGGENRTLVLGKLRIDHYMLSVLNNTTPYAELDNRNSLLHLILEQTPRSGEACSTPSK